jgi:hypothetical protein
MSWELMFFLPRVSDVGSYLVLGFASPKNISNFIQVNLGRIRMVATLLGSSCCYSLKKLTMLKLIATRRYKIGVATPHYKICTGNFMLQLNVFIPNSVHVTLEA